MYGGQAVIEGVMMRGKRHMTVAVRLEDGRIKVTRRKILSVVPILNKVPFVRGAIALVDSLRYGMKALTWSANQQLDEEETSNALTLFTTILSFFLAIFIFKFIPFGVAKLADPKNLFLFNAIDGLVKFGIFIGYIYLIGRMKDIQEVFKYHGAEHKAIACYEAKEPLTAKNALKFRKEHKRCGTNFLFIVIVISMLVYLLIPLDFGFFTNFGLRLALLPVIAGIAYEILKFGGKHDNWFTDAVASPGMLIQKLTTLHPTEVQQEVAIRSLKEVLKLEK